MAVIGNAPFQGLVSGGNIIDASIEGVDLSTSAIAARLGYTPVDPGAAAIIGGTINGTTIGATTAASGAFTTVSASGAVTLNGGTASTALALDASKNVVSVTNTGSGNNVLATSPTLVTPVLGTPTSGNFSTGTFTWPTFNQNTTGTAAGLSATLATASGGTGLTTFTANGVVYASSTSALATGSAFTFDGASLDLATVGAKLNFATTSSATRNYIGGSADGYSLEMVTQRGAIQPLSYKQDYGVGHVWSVTGSNALTLTSAYLYTAGNVNVGIGLSNPTEILEITRSVNQPVIVDVKNGTTGTAARSMLRLWADGDDRFTVSALSSSHTPSGYAQPSTALINVNASGGFNIAATNATGVIRFFTGDAGYSSSERGRFNSEGLSVIGSLSVGPSSGAGGIAVGSSAGRAQYQYINFGGGVGGTDYAWQIGRSPSGGVGPADGFYIYDLKSSATRLAVDGSGNIMVGGTIDINPPTSANAFAFAKSDNTLRFSNTTAAGKVWTIGTATPGIASQGDFFSFGRYSGSAWAEVARFDNAGRLMIGVTSNINASTALQVAWTNNTRIGIDSPDTQGFYFTKAGANNGTFRVDTNGNYEWYTKTVSQAMILAAGGDLLIGTTANYTTAKLYVENKISVNYSGEISMRYNNADPTENTGFWKGMTGTAPSGGTARGLHIFNYDKDSDEGINFWTGRPGVATRLMKLTPAGRLAIGTTDPAGTLDAGGNTLASQFYFRNNSDYNSGSGGQTVVNVVFGGVNIASIANTGTGQRDGIFKLLDENVVRVSIPANAARGGDTYFNAGGNFGINYTAPEVKLEVNGGADGSVVFGGRSDGGNGNNRRFNLVAFADGGGAGYGGGLKIQTRNSVNVFSDTVTVKSNGNVLLGTADRGSRLHVLQNETVTGALAITGTTWVAIDMLNSNADANARNWKIATTYNSFGRFELLSGTASGTQDYTTCLSLFHGASLALQGAVPQTGTGITFPANQNASANANTLDDYEEGTWNPALAGSVTAGSVAYTYRHGYYTKIGRLVYLYLDLDVSSFSGGAGGLTILGAPFPNANLSVYYPIFQPWQVASAWGTTYTTPTGFLDPNSSVIRMYTVDDGHALFSPMSVNQTGRISGYLIMQTD